MTSLKFSSPRVEISRVRALSLSFLRLTLNAKVERHDMAKTREHEMAEISYHIY